MRRNLNLYRWFQFARNLLFWMPVFFLFFSAHVTFAEVLVLEAMYYVAVVALELPSGYLSDRIGRVPTLRAAAGFALAGSLVFVFAGDFWSFALGQFCYAGAIAFASGTDSSLLYETLRALGREDHVQREEARAHTAAFAGLALGSLIGGVSAGFDLRTAYVLSSVAAAIAFALSMGFSEPAHAGTAKAATAPSIRGHFRDPVLRWLLAYAIVAYVLEHVPYEFLQPYVALVLPSAAPTSGYSPGPAGSGLLLAASMALAAVASAVSPWVLGRVGHRNALMSGLAVEVFIVIAMAAFLHPAVFLALLLRSAPMAVSRPILMAQIHPRLSSDVRATWLSVQSLAGRLAFAICLAGAAALSAGTAGDGDGALIRTLWGFALIGAVAIPLLHFTAPPLERRPGGDPD